MASAATIKENPNTRSCNRFFSQCTTVIRSRASRVFSVAFEYLSYAKDQCCLSGLHRSYRSRRIELLTQFPTIGVRGDHNQGEIELLVDPTETNLVEEASRQHLLSKGVPLCDAYRWSRSGVVAEDQAWIIMRDVVRFPTGRTGVYTRVIHKGPLGGSNGAAVLPLTPDGKILLNLNYRHATRTWEFELPRGGSKKGEKPYETAVRELEEETGRKCEEDPLFLGEIASDTGILAGVPHVYLCRIPEKQGRLDRANEAIKKCIPFTPEEIAEGLTKGYLVHEEAQVPLRDAFLAFAFLQALLRGQIQLQKR